VLVSRLRRKIETDPRKPQLIVTIPGFGYRFAVSVTEAMSSNGAG
jgi:DNA-binding response OmpR family regulator